MFGFVINPNHAKNQTTIWFIIQATRLFRFVLGPFIIEIRPSESSFEKCKFILENCWKWSATRLHFGTSTVSIVRKRSTYFS